MDTVSVMGNEILQFMIDASIRKLALLECHLISDPIRVSAVPLDA